MYRLLMLHVDNVAVWEPECLLQFLHYFLCKVGEPHRFQYVYHPILVHWREAERCLDVD